MSEIDLDYMKKTFNVQTEVNGIVKARLDLQSEEIERLGNIIKKLEKKFQSDIELIDNLEKRIKSNSKMIIATNKMIEGINDLIESMIKMI
jgi:peptidoglycan hydrolase CwlO-like protein